MWKHVYFHSYSPATSCKKVFNFGMQLNKYINIYIHTYTCLHLFKRPATISTTQWLKTIFKLPWGENTLIGTTCRMMNHSNYPYTYWWPKANSRFPWKRISNLIQQREDALNDKNISGTHVAMGRHKPFWSIHTFSFRYRSKPFQIVLILLYLYLYVMF